MYLTCGGPQLTSGEAVSFDPPVLRATGVDRQSESVDDDRTSKRDEYALDSVAIDPIFELGSGAVVGMFYPNHKDPRPNPKTKLPLPSLTILSTDQRLQLDRYRALRQSAFLAKPGRKLSNSDASTHVTVVEHLACISPGNPILKLYLRDPHSHNEC